MSDRTARCVCVRVVLCHRATKPTQRGRNEEQGNAVNEINVFSLKEPSLWRRALPLFSSRLIKKAILLPLSSLTLSLTRCGGSHI